MLKTKKTSTLEYATTLVNRDLKHVVEFGVYRGTTMRILREKFDDSFQLFGFDSFEGLPEDWKDASGKVVAPANRFDLQKNIPDIPNVKMYDGWFCDTIPQYKPIAEPFCLLHVDCDLYSSAKEVLYELNDFIVKDTIIVFDEWFYDHKFDNTDHEQKAFYEWSADKERIFELIDFGKKDPKFEQQIVKIHG